MSDLLSITEVGEATGLRSSALRYYEKAGLIEAKERVGGRRHFDPLVLQRLALIALLQEAGFTIAEISEIFGDRSPRGRWRSLAEQKLEAIDAHLERVVAARDLLTSALACECSAFENCDLVGAHSGVHRKAVQTLPLRVGRRHS